MIRRLPNDEAIYAFARGWRDMRYGLSMETWRREQDRGANRCGLDMETKGGRTISIFIFISRTSSLSNL